MSDRTPLDLLVIGTPRFISDKIDHLRKNGDSVDVVPVTTRQDSINHIKNLVANGRKYRAVVCLHDCFPTMFPLNEDIFSHLAPHVAFVTAMGAGYDFVDIKFLTANKAVYCNNPVAVSDPTATNAVMLILQTIRASSAAEMSLRSGNWSRGFRITQDVRDTVVGIIGMGSIGQLVRRKVEALGMKVTYFNRNRLDPSEEGTATYQDFATLIATADLITLHCPLNHETRHLLSYNEFKAMKDGVMIVNTSRGSVIDEEALVDAMESGKVNRVGLDVFENEPQVHPYLMSTPRASLHPHIAGLTHRGISDAEHEGLGNLDAWRSNGKGNTPVNFEEIK